MNNDYLYRAKKVVPDVQILSVMAAKRARQLAEGHRPMIKCKEENLLDIALLEIAEGLLSYYFGDEDPDAAKSAEAAEVKAAAENAPGEKK